MATINFPASPALNDTYSFNNNTWLWDGSGWQKQAPTITGLPSQTGHSNQYLSTDGTTASWTTVIPVPQVQSFITSGAISINWTGKDVTKLTLAGNATITNTGAVDGQKMILQLIQGGTGSYTVSFTSETAFGTTVSSITLSTAVGKIDMVGLVYSSANSKYNIVAYAAGY